MTEIISNFLLITTGLPASGKTTFSTQFKDFLNNKEKISRKVVIVDPDQIRIKISDDYFDPSKEKKVRKKNLEIVEKELKEGRIVISDDLNYYTSMRRNLKTIAQRLNKPYFIIHINKPLEVCLEWNIKRGKPIPNYLIEEIDQKFDSLETYSWEEPLIQLNMEKVDNILVEFEKLMKKIRENIIKRSKKKEKTTEVKTPTQQFNEKLESETRRIVGKLLQEPKYQKKKDIILTHRKQFVKNHLNERKFISDIGRSFKDYLYENLGIEFSQG